jgi:hypothetical protein
MSIGKGGSVTRTTHKPAQARKPETAVKAPPKADDDAELPPSQRPVLDPYDDAAPQAEAPPAPARPLLNPLWSEPEVYTPAERLDA